jgi:spectinomycin phosphotransferase
VLEKPDLADAVLMEYLRQGWDLTAVTVRFLPLGLDAAAWAYEIHTDTGEQYFLKVRRGTAGYVGALVAQHLHRQGLTQVVAPISTVDGQPWHRVDGYRLLLYGFLDAHDVWDCGLTDDQWMAHGAFLAALHATTLPEPLARLVPVDDFVCPAAARVRSLADRIRRLHFDDPWQRELAELWLDRDTEITALATRTEELARLAQAQRLPHVLCHADLHGANILVDTAGSLHVVDWDAPLLAPRERDLMFAVGTGIGEQPTTADQAALFERGYGAVAVNRPVLAYYRHQRVVEDLDEFARSALFDLNVGPQTRQNDLHWVRRILAPANTADLARSADLHPDPTTR